MRHGAAACRPVWVIGANLVATVLTAAVVGPSMGKLEGLGLVGWAARAPFYLVPLYLAPLVIHLRPRLRPALALGLATALPLALWAIATRCPPVVPVAYGVSVTGQAVLLSWMARRGNPAS